MAMRIVLRDVDERRWLSFNQPQRLVSVKRVSEVVDALDEIDRAVEKEGLTAVGFIAYEAAPAFDRALRAHQPTEGLPLLHFGLFDTVSVHEDLPFQGLGCGALGEVTATQTEAEHRESVRRIRDHIAGGETYQVNHTLRLRAPFNGDPRSLFVNLWRSQPGAFAAYLELDDLVICSASPELFFRLDGEHVVSRPMKGTTVRGHDSRSDRAREEWLKNSEKNRAENAMIVDMVRNDLGRIARVGSVEVTSSFDVERHPTVFQMTSTVEAATAAPVSRIMAALFPFASVTGAPKVRTMELIRELEHGPRGVYTGAIGFVAPNRQARFSVGIRTAVVDRKAGLVEYGVGSGIVWDSTPGDEYRECVLKARILSHPAPDFDLLETMLWEPESGFSLLDRHLDRLAGAAEYFGRPLDREAIEGVLAMVPGTELRSCRSKQNTSPPQAGDNFVTPYLAPPLSLLVRLLLAGDGSVRIETTRVEVDADPLPVRLGLAESPVAPENPFLHFKTTHREVYETARQSRPDCDDVLLWNEKGEVTESTIANLVAGIDGELVTPPVECGLLAGTFRAELIERGEVSERVIRIDELADVESLFLINSVQGWRDVEWVDR